MAETEPAAGGGRCVGTGRKRGPQASEPGSGGALRYDHGSMPDLAALLPLILALHIALAITLFVPGVLLPFTLRGQSARASGDAGSLVKALGWLQAYGTVGIGAGLAITGSTMVVALGARVVEQPWLLVSLVTYGAAAIVVLAFQRPALLRLQVRDPRARDEDRLAWREGARRQRYVAYGVTGAVGFIGFLMSTKPELW
jgi:Predicted integral membrane protein (DUF2269)